MSSLIPNTYPIATVENGFLQFKMEQLQTKLPIRLTKSIGHLPFTVITLTGAVVSVWIETKLLMKTFHVSERLVTKASRTYDLTQVILYEIIKNNNLLADYPQCLATLKSFIQQRHCTAWHLAKCDYLELSQNIYAGGEAIICNNHLLDGTPLTRVEHIINTEKRTPDTSIENAKEQILRMSAKVNHMHTKYRHIAQPLLIVNYVSQNGRLKNVTFYHSYQTIHDLLPRTPPFDAKMQQRCAAKLLIHQALHEGTHNYLNPTTVCFDTNGALQIRGMEYFSNHETAPILSPITAWSAPEYCRHFITYPHKTHIWSIGVILWCMQHNSLDVPFTSEMTQDQVNKIIEEDQQLTLGWKSFISSLLIVNPRLRPNIQEALHYFKNTIATKK